MYEWNQQNVVLNYGVAVLHEGYVRMSVHNVLETFYEPKTLKNSVGTKDLLDKNPNGQKTHWTKDLLHKGLKGKQ